MIRNALNLTMVLVFCGGVVYVSHKLALTLDILLCQPVARLVHCLEIVIQGVCLRRRPKEPEYFTPDLRGPRGLRVADTKAFQFIRGRDSDDKTRHLVFVTDGQALRVSRPGTAGPQPTQVGMDFKFDEVVGTTSRKEARRLEKCKFRKIHLCRDLDCAKTGEYTLHAKVYAGVPEDALVDLSSLATGGCIWRWLKTMAWLLSLPLRVGANIN